MENRLDMENQFINKQNELLARIDFKNQIDINNIQLIAGVDLAYWKENDIEYAVCCIVIIDFNTKCVIEKKCYKGKIEVPYISGCFAFREIPLVLKTVKMLENEPDIYVFDGNGYLHPRHMGLATHAGILLNKSSMGIAKSYLKIFNTDYQEPENENFAYKDIIIQGETFGRVVRTQKNVKPIFLSIGNKVNLETAMTVVQKMMTQESHIPLPTRLADLMTHEMRKQYQKGIE